MYANMGRHHHHHHHHANILYFESEKWKKAFICLSLCYRFQ